MIDPTDPNITEAELDAYIVALNGPSEAAANAFLAIVADLPPDLLPDLAAVLEAEPDCPEFFRGLARAVRHEGGDVVAWLAASESFDRARWDDSVLRAVEDFDEPNAHEVWISIVEGVRSVRAAFDALG
jgi:hypothetical protein